MKTQSLFLISILLVGVQKIYGQQGNIYNSVVGANSEPSIYNAVNLNSYELLTTNIQVSKENSLQKMVLAPFKLSENTSLGFLRETKINLAQKDGISTIGIGFGFDSSSPFTKKNDAILEGLVFTTDPVQGTDPDHVFEAKKAIIERKNDLLRVKAYEEMLKNSFKITAGYNISFFEIIGGDEVDLDQDGVIDNKHRVESNNFSMSLTFVGSIKSAVSLTGHYSSKLASSKDGEKRVDYAGGSLAYGRQVFVLNKKYEESQDYLKSLFVPSIVAGASLELQTAVSNKLSAKDGIITTWALTPFLDFKINPKNQFRIGVPIKRYSGIKKEIGFGPFLQWTLQFASIE